MVLRSAVCLFVLLFLYSTALAEKRIALVIGNSAYQNTPKLANPKNDAMDMAAALKKLGFQVIDGFDLDKAGFDRKIRDFATALQGAEMGVLFYAGHGLQLAGRNYLVPIDAALTTADALEFEMVPLDVVHRIMERQTNTNVIFLDACRDNPLTRNLARALGTRTTDVGRGLAAVESGSGTLISFSTQPGNVASDGSGGRNSPFTGSLVSHLSKSNDDLSAILIAVRNDVMNATQRKQVPWEHSALTKRVYFNPAAHTAPPPVAPAQQSSWSAVEREWQQYGKDTKDIRLLEAFKEKHKADPVYVRLAEERIEELKKQRPGSIPPSPLPKSDPSEQVAIASPPAQRAPPPLREDERRRNEATELALLSYRIRQCVQSKWNLPAGGESAQRTLIKLRLVFNPDGTLAWPPVIVNLNLEGTESTPYFLAASDAAIKAAQACQPFSLPPDKYDLWKDIVLNFDPRDMF
jgi:uncharacterized caspase-like protein